MRKGTALLRAPVGIWLLAVSLGAGSSALAGEEEYDHGLQGTCQGFLQATQILRQFHDPIALNSYREISEGSYETINKMAAERRMKPLPLPTAPEDYSRRLQLLEATCRKAPSLMFREAVTNAYMTLRQVSGLSNELPK